MPEQHSLDPNGHPEHSRKLPEFIIIEESEEEPFSSTTFPHKLKTAQMQRAPLKIRLLCFFIGIFALLWTIGAWISFFGAGVISLLLLRRHQVINNMARQYVSYGKRGSVVTTGLFIALFSPYLGLVMIFSYFMLQGEEVQQSVLATMLRSQFRDYL